MTDQSLDAVLKRIFGAPINVGAVEIGQDGVLDAAFVANFVEGFAAAAPADKTFVEGFDANFDAAVDAGFDAAVDAGFDAAEVEALKASDGWSKAALKARFDANFGD